MNFVPKDVEQRRVVETEAPLTVVLGGAGTGKTTSALAAARAHLERPGSDTDRVLFLSFSRASVARIADRSRSILGAYGSRVDILTFHALAYSIVRRFGSLVGRPTARLVSPPRARLVSDPDAIEYSALLPLALEIMRASPAVTQNLRARWGLVIVDEFQDTGSMQQDLLTEIAVSSRQILLGDQNQCIYTFLAADGVRLERIAEACDAAGAENTIELPATSYRDPSGVIPALARAVQLREFESPAVSAALAQDRLRLHVGIRLEDEIEVVSDLVQEIQSEGLGVAVFTHHNDMLATLSDGLERAGINHEIAGLSDALACALDAQVAMMRFAVGAAEWGDVLESLAVFVTSAQRGKNVPPLAFDILRGTGAPTLQLRIEDIRKQLSSAELIADIAQLAAEGHSLLGLPSKSAAWEQAAALLRPMEARAVRRLGRAATAPAVVEQVAFEAREATFSVLTDTKVDPHEVQLMNLYQTKGREADVTVVIVRQGDFMGKESEPFPSTSRLLYVVFSRARERIVVLLVGASWHAAVAPLARLAS